MQPFRFIHCGDLHLGAPFQYATGISRAVDRAVSEATYEPLIQSLTLLSMSMFMPLS